MDLREHPQADDLRRPPPEGDEETSGGRAFPHESMERSWPGTLSSLSAESASPRRHDSSAADIGASILERLLDQVDYGMVLASSRGAIRYANQPARIELHRHGPLCVEKGHLKTRVAADRETLRTALADAARGVHRLVSLRHNGGTVVVATLPLRGDAKSDGGEALALLTFGKRSPYEALSVEFFARTNGLTGAEVRVLQALCTGELPRDFADRNGIALSTVRSHMRSVRQKTQASSLRELVHRLAVLPPIPSAVKTVRAH